MKNFKKIGAILGAVITTVVAVAAGKDALDGIKNAVGEFKPDEDTTTKGDETKDEPEEEVTEETTDEEEEVTED